MKTKIRILKWVLVLVMFAGSAGAWAQPYLNQGNDVVCLNEIKHYAVINTSGSTYTWSIIPILGGA